MKVDYPSEAERERVNRVLNGILFEIGDIHLTETQEHNINVLLYRLIEDAKKGKIP